MGRPESEAGMLFSHDFIIWFLFVRIETFLSGTSANVIGLNLE